MATGSAIKWFEANINPAKETRSNVGVAQECSRATGLSVDSCRKYYARWLKSGKVTKSESAPAGVQGIRVSDFEARFDYESQLTGAIRRLCKTQFVSENDLRVESGIPVGMWRRVADLPAFSGCYIREGEKKWWSTQENVKRVNDRRKQWGLVR
jgi:hypothetical protein